MKAVLWDTRTEWCDNVCVSRWVSWRGFSLAQGGKLTFWCPVTGQSACVKLTSYLLYGSGAGEVETVVPLRLTMADDQQEILV